MTGFRCKRCGHLVGYRSRPRGVVEKFLLPLVFVRPVRCGGCMRRTYGLVFMPAEQRNENHISPAEAAKPGEVDMLSSPGREPGSDKSDNAVA